MAQFFFQNMLVFFLYTIAFAQIDIGDSLSRSYTKYVQLPRSSPEAVSLGWQKRYSLDKNLGEAWVEKPGIDDSRPITIYFGRSGQISGIGVDIWGDVPTQLQNKFFFKNGDNRWHIDVSFRSTEAIDSSAFSDFRLGDRLIINQGKTNYSLPLTEQDAINRNFQKGACFYSMGTHYFQDLTTKDDSLTWQGYNLLPVVPMFHNGVINAFFFASTLYQQKMFPPNSNEWEPIPLPNFAMCKNFCNSDCTWKDTNLWSTMHIYLRNYTKATCPGGCTIGCCSN